MVLTVYFVLSSVTGLFCHRRQRTNVVPAPDWADTTSANLTPASGVRTTRLRRPQQHRSSARRLIAHGSSSNPPCITLRAYRRRVHRTPPRLPADRPTPLLCGAM